MKNKKNTATSEQVVKAFEANQVFENAGHVLTYEVMGNALPSTDVLFNRSEYFNTYSQMLSENQTLAIGEYRVAPYGKEHNLLPYEIRDMLRENRVLPQLLEKQIAYLYGTGPYLYTEAITDGKITRKYIEDKKIQAWLDSWQKNGIKKDYRTYIFDAIREYYYTEGVFSKYRFTMARRVNGSMPVAGLELVMARDARFASDKIEAASLQLLRDEDFQYILAGNWLNPVRFDLSIYPRFNPQNPLQYPVCINYVKNASFGEDIYSYPTWYYGLREWVKGSNLNAKYINNYLKNSLNAKLHILIPGTWVAKKKDLLEKLCEKNRELKAADKPIQEYFNGVKLGTEYREEMTSEFIKQELRKITELMSGEGENQGKIFSSIRYYTEHGTEEWEFKEIPTKYKEFVQAILEYDKRTDEVIATGKGLDPSISNISKDGIISKSGADAYYNYMIYLSTQAIPEFIVCWDLNKAIELNFPYVLEQGIKIGFNHNIPSKTEEVSPQNRLNKTTV